MEILFNIKPKMIILKILFKNIPVRLVGIADAK